MGGSAAVSDARRTVLRMLRETRRYCCELCSMASSDTIELDNWAWYQPGPWLERKDVALSLLMSELEGLR